MDKGNPLVSVVMSVYNEADHLKEAIESILEQTYHNFEFIIIDDGSTDETPEILSSYDDRRLRIITQSNQGLTKSLNRGLKLSSGKYIARQDGSDISLKERLETQVDFLETHPDIALVGSYYDVIDSMGRYLKTKVLNIHYEVIRRSLRRGINELAHGSVMFKREIIETIGFYDERFRYAQDFEYWLRISERFKVINIPYSLYRYRLHKKPDDVKYLKWKTGVRYALRLAKKRRGED